MRSTKVVLLTNFYSSVGVSLLQPFSQTASCRAASALADDAQTVLLFGTGDPPYEVRHALSSQNLTRSDNWS